MGLDVAVAALAVMTAQTVNIVTDDLSTPADQKLDVSGHGEGDPLFARF
jgi:hypothetical protein